MAWMMEIIRNLKSWVVEKTRSLMSWGAETIPVQMARVARKLQNLKSWVVEIIQILIALVEEIIRKQKAGKTRFSNPTNGYCVEVSGFSGLWYFLIGPIYLFYRGLAQKALFCMIGYASLMGGSLTTSDEDALIAYFILTAILHIILSLMMKGVAQRHYLEKGWHRVLP
jgi:hypothetical protein